MVIDLKCMPNKLEMTVRTSPEHGSSSGTSIHIIVNWCIFDDVCAKLMCSILRWQDIEIYECSN